VIVAAVCWYPRFGLPYRDVKELLLERGVEVDHRQHAPASALITTGVSQ
jgi:transposase-like protein